MIKLKLGLVKFLLLIQNNTQEIDFFSYLKGYLLEIGKF